MSAQAGPSDSLHAVGGDGRALGFQPLRRDIMRTLQWFLVLAVAVAWVPTARPQERVVPEGTTVQLLLLRHKSVPVSYTHLTLPTKA